MSEYKDNKFAEAIYDLQIVEYIEEIH